MASRNHVIPANFLLAVVMSANAQREIFLVFYINIPPAVLMSHAQRGLGTAGRTDYHSHSVKTRCYCPLILKFLACSFLGKVTRQLQDTEHASLLFLRLFSLFLKYTN